MITRQQKLINQVTPDVPISTLSSEVPEQSIGTGFAQKWQDLIICFANVL